VHRDSESRSAPFEFEEVVAWLGHGFQKRTAQREEPPAPPTPDQLLEQARMLNQIYGGTTLNGSE